MMTVVASEELYPFYLELTQEEFTMRFNRTLFDHISSKLKESRDRNVADEDNIWLQPNTAFVNWFDENGIDIDSIEPFAIESGQASIEKEVCEDALWALADEMRYKKEQGEFDTYVEAYKYAADHYWHKEIGKAITADQLNGAYRKAKSEGRTD
jgi:hypothetical protein